MQISGVLSLLSFLFRFHVKQLFVACKKALLSKSAHCFIVFCYNALNLYSLCGFELFISTMYTNVDMFVNVERKYPITPVLLRNRIREKVCGKTCSQTALETMYYCSLLAPRPIILEDSEPEWIGSSDGR